MLNTAELFLQEICIYIYMYIYQSGILLEQGELVWKCKLLIPSYIFFLYSWPTIEKMYTQQQKVYLHCVKAWIALLCQRVHMKVMEPAVGTARLGTV